MICPSCLTGYFLPSGCPGGEGTADSLSEEENNLAGKGSHKKTITCLDGFVKNIKNFFS